MSLFDISYETGRLEYRSHHATEPESACASYLEQAPSLVQQSILKLQEHLVAPMQQTEDFAGLRWFPLPEEVFPRVVESQRDPG